MRVSNEGAVQLIPVESIHVLNPRVRNSKIFDGIVHNMTQVGIKRPITVTPRRGKQADGKLYDLVCGQGRLEAFQACGQKMIPALVVNASEEQALVMSLVENVARRKHKPMELLQGVEILRRQGYDAKAIGTKIGHKTDYVNSVIKLLDHGEERLVAAVETGQMPVVLAMDIAMSPTDEQRAIQDAYESKQLSGHKLMAVRRLLETRRRHGKGFDNRNKRSQTSARNLSAQEVLKAYKREVDRKRLLARKADAVNTRLLFIVEAMRCLRQEDHFMTLLRAEGLETMPKQLAKLLHSKG